METTDRKCWGISANGKWALCYDHEAQNVSVHRVVNGEIAKAGRWECSTGHLAEYAATYLRQYPVDPPHAQRIPNDCE